MIPSDDQLIALYGSLMRGIGPLESLGFAKGLRFLGPCVVAGRLFDLGPYPALRPGPGRVRGELHALRDSRLLDELDEFEGTDSEHPAQSLYLRERIRLIDPPDVEAWCYIYAGTPDPTSRIEDGDWRAHLARRKGHAPTRDGS